MTKTPRFRRILRLGLCGAIAAGAWAQSSVQQNAAQADFFEKSIRPVLVRNCQICHNAKAKTAALDLSTGAGFLAGGQSGPLIAKDDLSKSRLLRVISYDETLKMPPMGKLKLEDIAALTAWVNLGAPWPGVDSNAVAPTAAPAAGPEFTPEQKGFWAFQPVKKAEPPTVKEMEWVRNEIDRFILARLEAKGLKP